jgi:hypothetical protein
MTGDWKLWLKHLSPDQKVQVRVQLGNIHASTLSQWINGKRKPSKYYVQWMAKINPDVAESLQEDFPDAFKEAVDEPSELNVPRSYLEDIIRDRATVAEYVSQYTITNKVFEQLCSQLDPNDYGLVIMPAICKLDPESGYVTRLQVTDGYGTGPWKYQQMECSYEVGMESLSGNAVSRLRPILLLHKNAIATHTPTINIGLIESAGAFPILLRGKVAGALFIASVRPNFFNQARRDICELYAYLYALGMFEDQFYSLDRLQLQVIATECTQDGNDQKQEDCEYVR